CSFRRRRLPSNLHSTAIQPTSKAHPRGIQAATNMQRNGIQRHCQWRTITVDGRQTVTMTTAAGAPEGGEGGARSMQGPHYRKRTASAIGLPSTSACTLYQAVPSERRTIVRLYRLSSPSCVGETKRR